MRKIVVATDGSAASNKAIDRAIELANTPNVEIIVVTVAEDYCPIALPEDDCNTIRELIMKESKEIIQTALDKFEAAGIKAKGIVESGRPAETIIDIVKKENANEIIAASHGKHGVKRLLMGSVTSRLVELAPCHVIVVK